jgi:hypothetical protein
MTPASAGKQDIDELTRQVVDNAYAKFCAEQKMRPSELAAERFAVKVTESGAKDFHGMPSAELVQLLTREFPDANEEEIAPKK